MPAGDLIVADYQLELNAYLMGAGQVWGNDEAGWGGVFGSEVESHDTSLDLADGEVAAHDVAPARILTFPLSTAGVLMSPADVFEAAAELEETWAASGSTDIELHVQLPWFGHRYIVGRPRGSVINLDRVAAGEGYALCTFKAMSPTWIEDGS